MPPVKAPDKPLDEQSHKELDKTAKSANVEFSRKDLKREEKLRELRDANVPDPGAEDEELEEDEDDDADVTGEGEPIEEDESEEDDEPKPAEAGKTSAQEGEEPAAEAPEGEDDDAPPAGEQTPPDTLAHTSITEPEAVGEPGTSDPALDPGQVKADAKERVGGRTSDPSTRTEDARAADVEPDRFDAIAKPSDAGAEAYPFPPGGDVDVALVPDGAVEGEKQPPIPVGAFVRLGDHKDVPKRLIGHVGMVTISPTVLCNCDYAPRTHEHQATNQPLTVKMRDETDATLLLYPDAFEAVGRQGRHELLPTG